MNIYRNQIINLVNHSKSKFPRVPSAIKDRLWLDERGRDGQSFLELALNLIGNYSFDKKYIKEIDDKTFELKTTEGKIIRVQLEYGSIDDLPQIKVVEDNIEMSYNYVQMSGNSNLLYFDTTEQKDLKTGFIQYYNGDYDEVLMRKNGIITCVYFYNPNPPESYEKIKSSTFLVSDQLKEVIKKSDSSNIVELYNEIVSNLDKDITSFEIHSYDEKTRDTLNRIIVSNNKLAYILLTKKYSNGSVTLEEDHRKREWFSTKIENVRINYDDTLTEFDTLKNSLERKLKRD